MLSVNSKRLNQCLMITMIIRIMKMCFFLGFNPCDRVTCAYQCKNLGKGRYRCLCPEGQVLNNDRRTCRGDYPFDNPIQQ